jgi:hypothetical protein
MARRIHFCHPERRTGSALVAYGAATHSSSSVLPMRTAFGRVGAELRTLGIGSLLSSIIAVSLLTAPAVFAGDKNKPVVWKPIQQALLRVDDQPVKNWNVYKESKKGDPLLLEMNNRFLLIEVHERKIFELDPAKIERKGPELLWDPNGLPAEPLATSNWAIRDIGFAYRINARLVAENRVLDLQLPHPMDLRYL